MKCHGQEFRKSEVQRWSGKGSISTYSAWLVCAIFSIFSAADASAQDVSQALSFRPRQPDVNVELVTPEQEKDCSFARIKKPDGEGFLVTGPAGQTLRWFVDTNADNKLDRWCYFNNGVEVYREQDTNFDGSVEDYRWLSTEGLRWGVDGNRDGVIDSWKMISAEEVSAEVVRAASAADSQRFDRLLLTNDEIDNLGLGDEKVDQLKQRVRDAREQFEAWAKGQNVVTRESRWSNFGAEKPGVVPAGTDGSKQDIVVYENAVALIDNEGNPKQLMIGTLVQIDKSWKLVDLPKAITDGAVVANGSLFFPASFSSRSTAGAGAGAAEGISKAMERLVGELQTIDEKLVNAKSNERPVLHSSRADILEKLISASVSSEERTTWVQQFADTVGAAIQIGEYPQGVKRLDDFISKLPTVKASSQEMAYVEYRFVTAAHTEKLKEPKADFEKLQQSYIDDLEKFVRKYPEGDDAPDAMLQIALAAEFSGELDAAKQWYGKASSDYGDSSAGRKAAGALKRLNMIGKSFTLVAPRLDVDGGFKSDAYRGVPVVYHCWASWCDGCKVEMRALSQLQDKFAANKLKVVGINLDNNPEYGKAFLKQNSYPWVHVYGKDGLEGELAVGLGILTLPANFVVNAKGEVVKTGVHWTELEQVIESLVK